MQLLPKRKIILCKSQTKRNLQRKTATFGKCDLYPTQSQEQKRPSIIRQMMQELIFRACEIMTFHNQIRKVQAFSLIKNRSDGLKRNHQYLRSKVENRWAKVLFRQLRTNIQSNNSIDPSDDKIPSMKEDNKKIIKDLEQRVSRLEELIVIRSITNRSKSVKDILLSHRKQLSRLQMSTDGQFSHHYNLQNNSQQMNSVRSLANCLNIGVISPLNRPRQSIIVDREQQYQSSRGSMGSIGKQNKCLIKLRTKFLKIR